MSRQVVCNKLRLAAREIFNEALRAADSGSAVRNAVRFEGSRVTIYDKVFELPPEVDVFAVAMGKAATSMAVALGGFSFANCAV